MHIYVESPRQGSLAEEIGFLRTAGYYVMSENDLKSFRPELVIRDLRDKSTGPSSVNSIYSRGQGFCPVLALLAVPLESSAFPVWEICGDDFLWPPWRPEDFLLRVRTLSRMKKYWDASCYLMTHDSLTGLPNAVGLARIFEQERERFRRYKTPCSLALADLDHFKKINDTRGHLAGDRVLEELAGLLSRALRNLDVVARYGGEEFAILFPHTDLSGAACASQRLLETVRNHRFKNGITLTLSLGLADLRCAESRFEDLLHQADQALYQAKGAGRDRVACLAPVL